MLAVADYVENDGVPPEELTLAWKCKRWNTLPYSGGLIDQPATLIEKMTTAENVYNAYQLRNKYAEKQADFIKECKAEFDIIESIRKMRDGE